MVPIYKAVLAVYKLNAINMGIPQNTNLTHMLNMGKNHVSKYKLELIMSVHLAVTNEAKILKMHERVHSVYETDSGRLRDVRSCLVTGSFLPLTPLPLMTHQFPHIFFSFLFFHPTFFP